GNPPVPDAQEAAPGVTKPIPHVPADHQVGTEAATPAWMDATREREEQYRALADVDPDGIVVLDDSSTILSINPAMQTIFGYTADELIGQSLTMLMPEPLRAPHRRGVERYLATGTRTMSWTG